MSTIKQSRAASNQVDLHISPRSQTQQAPRYTSSDLINRYIVHTTLLYNGNQVEAILHIGDSIECGTTWL